MHYIYMLECADKTLYAGYTNNLERRLATHNSGRGSKFVRARLPAKMVYFEEYGTKSEALRREYQIKKMTRQAKLKLIKNKEEIDE